MQHAPVRDRGAQREPDRDDLDENQGRQPPTVHVDRDRVRHDDEQEHEGVAVGRAERPRQAPHGAGPAQLGVWIFDRLGHHDVRLSDLADVPELSGIAVGAGRLLIGPLDHRSAQIGPESDVSGRHASSHAGDDRAQGSASG